MNRSRNNMWLALLGGGALALSAVGPKPASAAPARQERSMQILFSFNLCNGQLVVGTEQAHLVAIPLSNGCVNYSVNIQGTGTDETGTRYVFSDHAQVTECNFPECPSSTDETAYIRLISQGGSPNDYVRTTVHLALDAECTLTGTVEVTSECRG
jgi:hypothetical protein